MLWHNRDCFFESMPGIDFFVAIVNLLSPPPDIGCVKVRRARISSAGTSVHKTKKPGTAGLFEE
jgi:hypothetical protein